MICRWLESYLAAIPLPKKMDQTIMAGSIQKQIGSTGILTPNRLQNLLKSGQTLCVGPYSKYAPSVRLPDSFAPCLFPLGEDNAPIRHLTLPPA